MVPGKQKHGGRNLLQYLLQLADMVDSIHKETGDRQDCKFSFWYKRVICNQLMDSVQTVK